MTPREIIKAVAADCEAAGVPVAFIDGWETRGRPGERFEPRMAIFHHTGGASHKHDYPSLGTVRDGRLPPDPKPLTGPLAHFGIGRHTGTVFVIAAGNANHAGPGKWKDVTKGNEMAWGIEEENDGLGETWGPEISRSGVILERPWPGTPDSTQE